MKEITGKFQGNLKKIEIYDKNDLIETKTFD